MNLPALKFTNHGHQRLQQFGLTKDQAAFIAFAGEWRQRKQGASGITCVEETLQHPLNKTHRLTKAHLGLTLVLSDRTGAVITILRITAPPSYDHLSRRRQHHSTRYRRPSKPFHSGTLH